jgi:hypothetical protein
MYFFLSRSLTSFFGPSLSVFVFGLNLKPATAFDLLTVAFAPPFPVVFFLSFDSSDFADLENLP